MKRQLIRLWKEEQGQDATEYALLLAFIVLGAIAVMSSLGSEINIIFSTGASVLTSAAAQT